jgi:hypothetical protein
MTEESRSISPERSGPISRMLRLGGQFTGIVQGVATKPTPMERA